MGVGLVRPLGRGSVELSVTVYGKSMVYAHNQCMNIYNHTNLNHLLTAKIQ